jgi:hypothetical protein
LKYRTAFEGSLPAGFDGEFNWDWMRNLFPRGIMPMDFDGVIEIGGHFGVFETKDYGVPIPKGQYHTLSRLGAEWYVFFIEGKDSPLTLRKMNRGRWRLDRKWVASIEEAQVWEGVEDISQEIARWAKWADRG